MPTPALATSDLLLRARFKAVLESPVELAKFSPKRQSYIAFAYAALDWWLEDQGNAGEPVPGTWTTGGDWPRHHRIILHWRGEVEAESLQDVFEAMCANGRASSKKKHAA